MSKLAEENPRIVLRTKNNHHILKTSSSDTSKFSNNNQTQVNETDIANHNHTKYQLFVKEAELSKLGKQYEKLVNEANSEHIKLTSSIDNLTQELAREIDEPKEK